MRTENTMKMERKRKIKMNHYPIGVTTRRIPHSCSNRSGTADPFAPITCPDCRSRLQIKINAHKEQSASYDSDSATARFFAADARHWENVLLVSE